MALTSRAGQAASTSGIDACLAKPLDLNELFEAIERMRGNAGDEALRLRRSQALTGVVELHRRCKQGGA